MSESLTIAVAQPVSRLHEVEANVEHHAVLIRGTSARVVVFPELSLTGYCLDAEVVDASDDRLAPLVTACAERGAVALVGASTAGPAGGRRISMLQVGQDGASVVYSKMCLGGEEPQSFMAGDRPARIDVDGWRLGLGICKDTGDDAQTAATASLGIDAYVAGVCETEADRAVPAAGAARIIAADGVHVSVASFAGATGAGYDETAGRSTIWRADGSVAAAAGRAPGQIAVARLTRA